MKLPVWALAMSGSLAMLVTSFDRVARMAGNAKDRVRDVAEGLTKRISRDLGTGKAVDYSSLVDHSSLGYRFRRDLLFPSWITVNETRTLMVSNGRVLGKGTSGTNSARLEGTFESKSRVSIGTGHLEWRMEHSSFLPTMMQAARDRDGGGLPESVAGLMASGLDGKAAQFGWDGKSWRPTANRGKEADFIEGAWANDLQKDLPVLLTVSGLMPRSMWFGGRRMAVGEQMTLQGSQVTMLTGYPAEGEVTLTLERVEDVDAHPCGVFAWNGRVEAKTVPSPDGPRANVKLRVTEGHTWMSLVYPVVLRCETHGSREVDVNTGTAAAVHWRGDTRELVERHWRVEN